MQDGTKRAVVWTAIRGPAPPSTNGFSAAGHRHQTDFGLAPPSTNGFSAAGHRHQTDFGLAPPSTNGFSGSGPPSPNGFWPCATVNKRVQRQRAPVNKRFFGLAPPSTNGFSAAGRRQQTDLCLAPPSTNGFSAAGHRQQTGLSAAGRRQQTVFLVLRHRQTNGFIGSGPPSTNGFWSCATVNKRPNRQRGPSSSHAVVRLGLCAHSSDATAVCRPVATCGRMPICT